ncbi:hypothetical protein LCGC14_3097280 [marine sediment metagenome]|uniref:Uncharacterized protein n=1 Tax=marine sediment metagenome TaxID=412755 RepID=A0A0F8YG75_9ZZZZ
MTEMVMSKEDIIQEMEDLMYKEPKCDFEHIWNCTIDKCTEIIETGGKEDTSSE